MILTPFFMKHKCVPDWHFKENVLLNSTSLNDLIYLRLNISKIRMISASLMNVVDCDLSASLLNAFQLCLTARHRCVVLLQIAWGHKRSYDKS